MWSFCNKLNHKPLQYCFSQFTFINPVSNPIKYYSHFSIKSQPMIFLASRLRFVVNIIFLDQNKSRWTQQAHWSYSWDSQPISSETPSFMRGDEDLTATYLIEFRFSFLNIPLWYILKCVLCFWRKYCGFFIMSRYHPVRALRWVKFVPANFSLK